MLFTASLFAFVTLSPLPLSRALETTRKVAAPFFLRSVKDLTSLHKEVNLAFFCLLSRPTPSILSFHSYGVLPPVFGL